MHYLIHENAVVGACFDKPYAMVNNFAMRKFDAPVKYVSNFNSIFAEGCYLTRVDNLYIIRKYITLAGYVYNTLHYDEILLYVSSYDGLLKSALRPLFMEQVEKEHILKPVLKRTVNI